MTPDQATRGTIVSSQVDPVDTGIGAVNGSPGELIGKDIDFHIIFLGVKVGSNTLVTSHT